MAPAPNMRVGAGGQKALSAPNPTFGAFDTTGIFDGEVSRAAQTPTWRQRKRARKGEERE